MFIFTEKMDMDLKKYMNLYRERLTEYDILKIFKMIADALIYLHGKGIIHMDIKPENILININYSGKVTDLRISDFGLATTRNKINTDKMLGGSAGYMAPELRKLDQKVTLLNDKVDSYSLGVVLYNLVCGGMPGKPAPKPKKKFKDKSKPVLSARAPRISPLQTFRFQERAWDQCSPHIIDLVKLLLKVNVEERIRVSDSVDHQWVKVIEKE